MAPSACEYNSGVANIQGDAKSKKHLQKHFLRVLFNFLPPLYPSPPFILFAGGVEGLECGEGSGEGHHAEKERK